MGKISNIQKEKELIGCFLISREALDLAVDNNFMASEMVDKFHKQVAEIMLQISRVTPETIPTINYILDNLNQDDKETENSRIRLSRYKKMIEREIVQDKQILDIAKDNMKELRDLHTKRTIIHTLKNGLERIEIPAQEFLSNLKNDLARIEIQDANIVEVHIHSGFKQIKQEMEYQVEHGIEFGYKTHFRDIDRMLEDNISKGSLTYIVGRPSNYKTGFALNVSLNMAKNGTPTAIFSHEMSPGNCYRRILSRMTGIEMSKLKKPKLLTPEDWAALDKAIKEVETYPLYIIDGSKLNIALIDSICAYLKSKYKIEVVFWDYFQLIRKRDGVIPTEERDFAEVSEELRMLPKKYDFAAIALSQANRSCEQRDDKRPTLKDIRNTGKAEQDAENILYVYRDEFYHMSQTDVPNHLEVGAIKVREGELKRALLHFNGAKATLADCDPMVVMDKSRDYIGGGGMV